MQGFNMGRYRPPDADPRVDSFNFHHPLGPRARKISEGILVVRFALPFNAWCLSCNSHLGRGVRYNAEKKQVGLYLDEIAILEFRCKCHLCQKWFTIRTDPQNTRYVCVDGIREKVEDWQRDEAEGSNAHSLAGTVTEVDKATILAPNQRVVVGKDGEIRRVGQGGDDQSSSDAFTVLEKETSRKSAAAARQARILELEGLASSRSADPYTLNSRLRSRFRKEKKAALAIEAAESDAKRSMGWNEDRKLLMTPQDTEERDNERKEAKRMWEEDAQRADKKRIIDGVGRQRTTGDAPTPLMTTRTTRMKGETSPNRHSIPTTITTSNSGAPRSTPRPRPGSGPSPGPTLNPTATRLAQRLLANKARQGGPFG